MGARVCIRVYEISYIRESVRWISNNWQGRVWSGKHFNSDSRLGSGSASDLILGYYLVFSGLANIKYLKGQCLIIPSFLYILKE